MTEKPVAIVRFNTNRPYTRYGQRITASLYADGSVTFYDQDRMIDGGFDTPVYYDVLDLQNSPGHLQALTIEAYDTGAYHSTERSFRDGLEQGGVNTPPAAEDEA